MSANKDSASAFCLLPKYIVILNYSYSVGNVFRVRTYRIYAYRGRAFHNLRASKSTDRLILCSLKTLIDGL